MRRISRAVLALLTLVGFVVAAAPLRADEEHCARPAASAVDAHHPVTAHAAATAPGNGLTTGHRCPACPARSCGAMHGCSATLQLGAEPAALQSVVRSTGRAVIPGRDVVLSSITHSPPTPPPLVALSIA